MEKGGDTVLPSVAEHVAGGSPSGNGVGDEVRRYRIHVSICFPLLVIFGGGGAVR